MPSSPPVPPDIEPMLRRRFPTVDWSRVQVLRGLPWWVTRTTNAITLPHPLSRTRFRIHMGEGTDLGRAADRSTLVHEAVHAAQFMASGDGLGWWRPGFVAYVAAHLAHGYRGNPFEREAYTFEREGDEAVFAASSAPLSFSLWWLIAAPAVAVMALLAVLGEIPLRRPGASPAGAGRRSG